MLDHGAEAAPELVECDPKPLAIDLFCGLGGWSDGLLAEGWRVVGFDIERHSYGDQRYPAQLVLQDVLTIHGSQFRAAALIVASPPCQEFSYFAMPWSRAKQIAGALRASNGRGSRRDSECCFPDEYSGSRSLIDLTALFDACFRIQREAIEAAGRHIPLVVENVKGAQPWVGRARANFGSFYLWGDVDSIGGRIVKRNDIRWGAPSVKAAVRGQKFNPDGTEHGQGSWFKIADSQNRGSAKNGHIGGGSWFAIGSPCQENVGQNPAGRSVNHGARKNGDIGGSWFPQGNGARIEGNNGRDGQKVPGFNFHEHEKTGQPGRSFQSAAVANGTKQAGLSWPAWFDHGAAAVSSKSDSRKAASAQIAKIPFALASHIARIYKPSHARD